MAIGGIVETLLGVTAPVPCQVTVTVTVNGADTVAINGAVVNGMAIHGVAIIGMFPALIGMVINGVTIIGPDTVAIIMMVINGVATIGQVTVIVPVTATAGSVEVEVAIRQTQQAARRAQWVRAQGHRRFCGLAQGDRL